MTTLYKLTNQAMRTYNGYQWTLGGKHTASGEGELCSDGWLHAYTDPLLAVLLNPIHANIKKPRLFRAEGVIGKADLGLKVGCTELTLVEEIPLPSVTIEQRVRFAILCALEVCNNKKFRAWANQWLSGKDRTADAANAAAANAYAAAYAAAYADAAYAAAYAANAANAAYADAAYAAYAAADAAAYAADAADADATSIDLVALAHRVIGKTNADS